MGQVCSGDRKGGKDKMDSLAFHKQTIDERRSIVEYNGTNGNSSYDDMNRMPDIGIQPMRERRYRHGLAHCNTQIRVLAASDRQRCFHPLDG